MIGQTLGHYRIVEKIGAGGMGEVYRAHDEHLERDVAIKVLPAGTLADEAARKRFRKEALALSKLNHPNIATVFDFDTQKGVDFLVMELVAGESLSEKLPGRPLAEKDVLRIGAQLAEGLAAAHKQSVIHRDLKPGNLRLTSDGSLKILDFGLAKLLRPVSDTVLTESVSETQAGAGTLPYMAPEQLRGEKADARSDIHAAGVVLYELATGRRPFQESLSTALTDAILHKPPPPPGRVNVDISPRLEEVILKCLEKDPDHRYQSARELLVDLRRLATPTAVPLAPSPQAPAWGRIGARWRAVLGVGAVATLVAVLLGLNVGGMRERLFGRAAPKIESLAVLPLDNLSGDPEQDYFVEGMHEALTAELSKVKALKVVSRTSAMRYKGTDKPMPQIARELDVDALIEGSVAREGDQVRITVQLIHGPTDRHLWADSYQRELRGVLALQSEVARAIAREIRITVTPAEQTQLARASVVSPAAHEAYLLGRFYANKRTEDDLRKAISYFEEATRIDPDFALGYAGLADAHRQRSIWGDVPFSESAPLIRAAVLKALQLDGSLAEGHTALGAIKFEYDWDWTGAEKDLQRALELNPNYADAHQEYSFLLSAVGRQSKAIEHIQRARELDPLSPATLSDVGRIYYRARQYQKAIEYYRKTIELDPTNVPVYGRLSNVYAVQRRYREAQAALEQGSRITGARRNLEAFGYLYAVTGQTEKALDAILELKQHGAQAYYPIALIYLGLGDKDQAMAWLEKAYQERVFMIFLKTEPRLDPLRDAPRFQALLRRMNFPEN